MYVCICLFIFLVSISLFIALLLLVLDSVCSFFSSFRSKFRLFFFEGIFLFVSFFVLLLEVGLYLYELLSENYFCYIPKILDYCVSFVSTGIFFLFQKKVLQNRSFFILLHACLLLVLFCHFVYFNLPNYQFNIINLFLYIVLH